MKHILRCSLLFLLSIVATMQLSAQKAIWASRAANPGISRDVVMDKWGNSFLIGTNQNITIDKYNKAGQLIWTRQIVAYSSPEYNFPVAAVDDQGNVFIAGTFSNTVDLDPGPATATYTPVGSSDIFVQKLDSAGQSQWIRVYGSTAPDHMGAITADGSGGVYFTGEIRQNIDMDPGPASVFNNGNGVIARLNGQGDLLKVAAVSAPNFTAPSVATDPMGNVLLCGSFSYTADFDPGPGVNSITAASTKEMYGLKLSSNLDFVWVKTFVSTSINAQTNVAAAMRSDPSGNVLIAGAFTGTIDADPGTNTSNISSVNPGTTDIFFIKLKPTGAFMYAKQMGNSEYDAVKDMEVDASGNIFMIGNFTGEVDFDPGPGVSNLFGGSYNNFIIKLTSAGKYLWGQPVYSIVQIDHPRIAINNDNDIRVSGSTGGNANFFNNVVIYSPAAGYVARLADANNILGEVFFDNNGNGLKDGADHALPGITVKAAATGPRVFYALTDTTGAYNIITDTGNYNITVPVLPLYYSATVPVSQQANFGTGNFAVGKVDSLNNFGLVPVPGKSDVEVTITNITAARPGMPVSYLIHYKNKGTVNASGTVSLQHDGQLQYASATPSPVNYSNPVASWNFTALPPLLGGNITVHLNVPVTTVPGITLQNSVDVQPALADENAIDNFDTSRLLVTASYDPNDKQVSPAGDIYPAFVSAGNYLDYTIRFQNTGTDTAFNIVITDTLSSLLDLSGLEVVAASHPYTVKLQNKIASFIFSNILLPDSNKNEALSHGFIRYKIKAVPTAVVGDMIKNTAYIGFDFNENIQTNTVVTRIIKDSVHRVCASSATSLSLASPGTGYTFQWRADAGEGFVDIANNTVYAGVNTSTLQISNISTVNHTRYQCIASNGAAIVKSTIFILTNSNTWTGAISTAWELPANWSCGLVPDANTELLINAGMSRYPVISSPQSCWKLSLAPGAECNVTASGQLTILGQ